MIQMNSVKSKINKKMSEKVSIKMTWKKFSTKLTIWLEKLEQNTILKAEKSEANLKRRFPKISAFSSRIGLWLPLQISF